MIYGPKADAYEKNKAKKKSKLKVIPSLMHSSLPAVTELRIIVFFLSWKLSKQTYSVTRDGLCPSESL